MPQGGLPRPSVEGSGGVGIGCQDTLSWTLSKPAHREITGMARVSAGDTGDKRCWQMRGAISMFGIVQNWLLKHF